MKTWLLFFVAILCVPIIAQEIPSGNRQIEHFECRNKSRLGCLARAGAATGASLLIEAGDLNFLQQSMSLSIDHASLRCVIGVILKGREDYAVRQQEKLLIVRPARPAKPLNRILSLPLGPLSIDDRSISSLDSRLGFEIRRVTGCRPQGYAYAGPPLDAGIPPVKLNAATFEKIVTAVASAVEPSMWIVMPDSGEIGCISSPTSEWQVGLYAVGIFADPKGNYIFQGSIGPQLVK